MPLRTRLFIFLSIIALVILGMSVFLLIAGKKARTNGSIQTSGASSGNANNQANSNAGTLPNNTPSAVPSGVTVKQATSAQVEENAVKQLAKIFAERYNTYSTDDAYQNIKDVQTLVTTAYWKKIGAKLGISTASSTFQSVTAEALIVTPSAIGSGAATVAIKLRRTVIKNGTTTTEFQDIIVALVKSGGNWLIDNQTVASK